MLTGHVGFDVQPWAFPRYSQREEPVPRRCRRHQDRGGRSAGFQVLLHDEPAHGVPDQNGGRGQGRGDRTNIIDVVGDRALVKRLRNRAAAMSAQAQGDRPVTVVREEIEEMVIPAPCAVCATAVDNFLASK